MGISTILATAVLAVNALAIDIPAVPTWPSGRCTDKSLTIPSWTISKYTVSGGVTTFQVINRASDNGRVADMTCEKLTGDCGPSGNDELRGSVSVGPNGPVIKLSEIWTCADEGDRVLFSASGSTTITQCSGTDCVSAIPYLVPGVLSLPVPVTPAQPSPPSGFDAATCASVGKSQWSVTDLSFRNMTKGQCKQWYIPDRFCLEPVDEFVFKGVYLDLKVKNKAINHEISCSFEPTSEKSLPSSPLRCSGGEFNNITLDVSLTGQAPNFDLKVEELWYCLENPSTNVEPSAIVAKGSTSLKLDCSTTPGFSGGADDIITICKNPNSPTSVDGTQSAKKKLPAFSLVSAWPVHGGCTFDSVINPTWYMRGLRYLTNGYTDDDKNTGNVTIDSITVGLTGPGFADYFFYNGTVISGSGIDSVYSCTSLNDGQPIHWKCSYSLDPFKRIFTLNKVWQCSDKDEAHPIYFEGSGSFDWSVDPYYVCGRSGYGYECYWHDSLANQQPGIPFDIPKITTSLVNDGPTRPKTVRLNNEWSVAT